MEIKPALAEERGRNHCMLKSAFGFLAGAILAAVVGFSGFSGGAADISKFLFFLFLAVFLFLFVMAILTGRSRF